MSLDRIKQLIEELRKATFAYEHLNREIITNYEYDKLYDELALLEKETGIILSNSPTQKVGYEVVSNLPKMNHEYPAKSLDKTKEVSSLVKHIGKRKGSLSWKLDGLSVILTYQNGALYTAVSRGSGVQGEDITSNARTFKNIPLTIPFTDKLIVRGEAVISYENFNEINNLIPDDEKYKNPRNLASGSVRQLDSSICAKRNVEFIAYDIMNSETMATIETKEHEYALLKEQGFDVVGHKIVDADNMEEAVTAFTEESKSYAYPVDGLVLAHNDLAYGRSLGDTAKFPLHSIAFKWADEAVETKLIDIEWNTSRTGLINPVAIFEPVEIDGTTVERASLHNLDIINSLELGIGDTITVIKANMIIPQVEENLTRSNTWSYPKECPVCGTSSHVHTSDNGVKTLYCTNDSCSAKIIKKLSHFVSKNGMNIDGLSEATLEKLVEAGLIKDIPDIYGLSKHKTTICKMDGMGLRSYNKLIMSIEKSRKVNMANFIYALGIPNVGLSTAKDLVKAFDNDFENISNATRARLMSVDGIGEVVANNIYSFFDKEENDKMAYALFLMMSFEQPKQIDTNSSIAGKTFVITGDVHIFKNRKEVQAKIEELGGKVSGSVSKATSFLINNDKESSSSKNKKARELNIAIITEEEFLEMINH